MLPHGGTVPSLLGHRSAGKVYHDKHGMNLQFGYIFIAIDFMSLTGAARRLYAHRLDELRAGVIGQASLLVRPHSLADPTTIETLKSLLRANVGTTKKGLVYAYAFDDEISLGSFNNPAEVDAHPLSLAWYRRWLSHRYGAVQNLNIAWDTSYASFDTVDEN